MASELVYATAPVAHADAELVVAVREGDDEAFNELYRRYEGRIGLFVRSRVGDPGRAEDVTQEVFLSAVRRLRATDGPVAFKPWIYEIARNASIDSHRRTSRSEEVSFDEGLSPSDRVRLVSPSSPDVTFAAKQRIENLYGAFAELPPKHTELLVMRELEGLSYRQIEQRTGLSRAAVESALFRARRRLEAEFSEIDTGRRCAVIRGLAMRQADGVASARERVRVDRHVRRCDHCRRFATEVGAPPRDRLRTRVAALLPLPAILRRRLSPAPVEHSVGSGWAPLAAQGQDGAAVLLAKSAAVVATLALAGTGGVELAGHSKAEPTGDKAAPAAKRVPSSSSGRSRTGARPTGPGGSARRVAPRARGGADQAPARRPHGTTSDGRAPVSPGSRPRSVPGTDPPAVPAVPPTPEVEGTLSAPRTPAAPKADPPATPSVPPVPRMNAPAVPAAPVGDATGTARSATGEALVL